MEYLKFLLNYPCRRPNQNQYDFWSEITENNKCWPKVLVFPESGVRLQFYCSFTRPGQFNDGGVVGFTVEADLGSGCWETYRYENDSTMPFSPYRGYFRYTTDKGRTVKKTYDFLNGGLTDMFLFVEKRTKSALKKKAQKKNPQLKPIKQPTF